MIDLATALKSTAIDAALKKAQAIAQQSGTFMPPEIILNASTPWMTPHGSGAGYIYDPNTPGRFSGHRRF